MAKVEKSWELGRKNMCFFANKNIFFIEKVIIPNF